MSDRIRIVCDRCGNTDIRKDAWAGWNIDEQKWELIDVFDKPNWCMDCDGECSPIEKPL